MAREKLTSLDGVNPKTATGRTKEMFDQTQAAIGFVPNMYENMAKIPALLDTYLLGYQQFREQGGFTPPEQEVVFLTISRLNSCEYCMSAHSMIGDKMTHVPADVLKAIRTDDDIPDAKLAALASFTTTMVETKGNPKPSDIAAFRDAGYEDRHILAIILALSVKVISNYSNHLFATELDAAFDGYNWPESDQ